MDAALGPEGLDFDEFCRLVHDGDSDAGSVHGLDLYDARYGGMAAGVHPHGPWHHQQQQHVHHQPALETVEEGGGGPESAAAGGSQSTRMTE